MVSRRFVSLALTLTLLAAGLPVLARAEAAPEPLRASIDRALTAPAPTGAPAAPVRRNQSGGTYSGGGGGGGRMILAVVGMAVSVGATYYVIKQTRKTNDPTPSPSFR
ncbi:MAG: hypothetical protein ABW221_17710 [Vicinamibacteria bacterium]